MTPLLASLEIWAVAGYLALTLAIGFALARKNRGGVDFFAGGRAIPWWVSGVSLYMGNFSAWLFTGGAGMIYRTTGYGLIYFLGTGALAYFLGSQLSAALWRRSRVISPVEYTRVRFGLVTQQVLGLITAVVFIAAAGNQLKAIATIVESILGVDLTLAAIGIGVIVILYTLLGGLWAVMVTDVLQFVVLLAITLLIAPLAVGLVDGGLTGVANVIDFTIPPPDGDPGHGIHFLIASLLLFTIGVGGGQGPRFYCVPTERDARKVGALAAVLFLTTPVLFALPPLVARALWGGPASLAEVIPGADPHEQVFVEIAKRVLPPGLLGVFLAAMFAATMSALDTVYNMVASVLSRDVWAQFRKNVSDRALLGVGRWMTAGIGAITIGICLAYVHSGRDLFSVMMTIVGLSAPVLNVPMLMGLMRRRAPRSAGLACIIWGTATALVTSQALGWSFGPQVMLTHAVCLLVFFMAPGLGRLWKRRGGVTLVILLGLQVSIYLGALVIPKSAPWSTAGVWAWLYAAFMGVSFVAFARWFSLPEDRTEVDAFHRNLDTPVNVDEEVTGSDGATGGVLRLVGVLTLLIAGLTAVLMLAERVAPSAGGAESGKYLVLITILAIMGGGILLAGRKNENDD